jgi:hypothetical protein
VARCTWICGRLTELLVVAVVVPVGYPGLGVVDTAAAVPGVRLAVDARQATEVVGAYGVEPPPSSDGGNDRGLGCDELVVQGRLCGHGDVS